MPSATCNVLLGSAASLPVATNASASAKTRLGQKKRRCRCCRRRIGLMPSLPRPPDVPRPPEAADIIVAFMNYMPGARASTPPPARAKAMEMKRLSGGNLRAAGYDDKNRVLVVELSSGAFQYAGVTAETWRRFAGASSPWSFFRDNIDEEYPAKRI